MRLRWEEREDAAPKSSWLVIWGLVWFGLVFSFVWVFLEVSFKMLFRGELLCAVLIPTADSLWFFLGTRALDRTRGAQELSEWFLSGLIAVRAEPQMVFLFEFTSGGFAEGLSFSSHANPLPSDIPSTSWDRRRQQECLAVTAACDDTRDGFQSRAGFIPASLWNLPLWKVPLPMEGQLELGDL